MALPAKANLPQDTSIVSRWKLDEGSGSRSDSVGSNDLTDNNTVTSGTGPFGDTCADFEQANSEYLSITDASQSGLENLSAFSCGMWIYFESSTNVIAPFSKGNFGAGSVDYMLSIHTNGNVYFYIASGAQRSWSWSPADATWYHITATYNAGSVAFYIDGAQYGSTQSGLASSTGGSTADFMLGRRHDSADLHDGLMQDAIFWDVALSGAEVTDLYNSYDTGGGLTPIERETMRGMMRGTMRGA